MTAENILVKHPLGHVEFTPEELEETIADFEMLLDAFLVVLYPEHGDWELPSKEKALELTKEMYLNRIKGYSKEFIKQVFEHHEK